MSNGTASGLGTATIIAARLKLLVRALARTWTYCALLTLAAAVPAGARVLAHATGAVGPAPTTMFVSCGVEPPVGVGDTCTAIVEPSSGSSTPTGTVTLALQPATGSVTSSDACTLVGFDPGGPSIGTGAGDGQTGPAPVYAAECLFGFKASAQGAYTITASYGGDATHQASSAQTTVEVTGPYLTRSAVSCAPSAGVAARKRTTCTVTVTDAAASDAIAPTGSVTVTASPSKGLSRSAGACTLATTAALIASACHVTFTPSAVGSYRITANYGGDTAHQPSAGHRTLKVAIGDADRGREKRDLDAGLPRPTDAA